MDGKTAVFYSKEASSSEHRYTALGKAPGEPIHSGELAELHEHDHPDTVRLEHTVGGRELQQIDDWIKSDAFRPADRTELDAAMKPLWEDASVRFAKSAANQRWSVGYVEHTQPDTVYSRLERPTIGENPEHVHLTDAPLNPDGSPSNQDQIPDQMLDNKGRMHGT